MGLVLDFEKAKAFRTKEAPTYHMDLEPSDIGLSIPEDQMGVDENGKPNKTVRIQFRTFTRDEYNDILEQLKDEKDPKVWVDEKDFALVQLCLVQPAVPATADGRKFLEGWLPGVLASVRDQIEKKAGYNRNFYVEKAGDALKNSETPTSTPTSNSK